jgi:hypothetical protein
MFKTECIAGDSRQPGFIVSSLKVLWSISDLGSWRRTVART